MPSSRTFIARMFHIFTKMEPSPHHQRSLCLCFSAGRDQGQRALQLKDAAAEDSASTCEAAIWESRWRPWVRSQSRHPELGQRPQATGLLPRADPTSSTEESGAQGVDEQEANRSVMSLGHPCMLIRA